MGRIVKANEHVDNLEAKLRARGVRPGGAFRRHCFQLIRAALVADAQMMFNQVAGQPVLYRFPERSTAGIPVQVAA